MLPSKQLIIPLIVILLLLSACSQVSPTANLSISSPTPPSNPLPSAVAATPTGVGTPSPSATPALPSPTPAPLAARVNQQGIWLADYEAELKRLQSSLKELGQNMPEADQKQRVLDLWIDQSLLAQAAAVAGYQLSDADFQKRLDTLVTQAGGQTAFSDWLARNFYTEESFRRALRLSIAAAWQRDALISKAPQTADQVHARQILVLNEDLANRLYAQLQAGADFATLSSQVDPESGGELGWFPKDYLILPEIEQAAFALQPGKYSPILKTTYGYHIVFMVERDANHPLSADARLEMQRKLLSGWLKEHRAQSQLEILVK
jgi:peptidyl-prolyl cis-trans isomerase C